MGTRAVVRHNGEFLYATHWDGYPESLGKALLNSSKNVNSLIKVGAAHSIDLINKKYAPAEPLTERIGNKTSTTYFYDTDIEGRKLAYKHIYKEPYEEPKEGKDNSYGTANAEGTVKLTQTGDPASYGDYAEYIYDIRGDAVYVAEGKGDYDSTKAAERAGKLNWKRYVGGSTGKKTVPLAKKEKGWFSESARHSLARKGFKTGRKK